MDFFDKLKHLDEISKVASPIGFIAKDTNICMSDTNNMLIQNIRILDSISLPNGKACKIFNMFKGFEETIYRLTLDNGISLCGTETLMVMTRNGFCQLRKLKKTDYVQTISEGLLPVTEIVKLNYHGTVFNLGLENGKHEMICNDIHVCDYKAKKS